MEKPGVPSLLDLANENGSTWEAVADTCLELAAEGSLSITSVGEPSIHQMSKQRVHAFEAIMSHDSLGHVEFIIHIGVSGDNIFTGYEEEEYCDYYRVTLPNGQQYADFLFDPEKDDDEEETAVSRAWMATAPLRNATYWTLFARLLEGKDLQE